MNIPKHYDLEEGGPLGKEIVLNYHNIKKSWQFQIENSSLSQRLSMQLNNNVREAFVVSVTYSLHLVRR